MELIQHLPPGRAFEKEVLGVTEEVTEDFIRFPAKLSLKSSIQQVISYNWAMYAESVEKGLQYCHNPARPEMGKTAIIWSAVNKHLPRWVKGCKRKPLHLYIAVGRVALDWRHGVDAFFWWEGAFVTIDVSLIKKDQYGKTKADFILTPEDLEGEPLSVLAKRIAGLLKHRRTVESNKKNKKRRREKLTFE